MDNWKKLLRGSFSLLARSRPTSPALCLTSKTATRLKPCHSCGLPVDWNWCPIPRNLRLECQLQIKEPRADARVPIAFHYAERHGQLKEYSIGASNGSTATVYN